MSRTSAATILIALLAAFPAAAQETRSMIFGRVFDPSSAAVAAARVAIVNADTNVAVNVVTNETGYYEAPLLLPGNYQVVVQADGFKKHTRSGILLPISTRTQIDCTLEVGSLSESVSVTGEAPLLETNAVSTGQVIDQRSLQDLPTLNNNPTLLARLVPGIQTTGGAAGYNNPAFTLIGSSFTVAGNVGGNDFAIDGIPNNGNIRRISYQPHTDAVQEFKVETSNFDASVGHSSGATFSVMTKAGTNAFHGSASWQHWRNEWNAANFFAKKNHYQRIAAAEAAGNTAQADSLRGQNINPAGHSNNYSGAFGGPVRIPGLYDGKDKMFFFVSYSGLKDRTAANTVYYNRTVPTMANRQGDFSDLLNVDPTRYQIYDPLSVRPDTARPTHYIRDAFPGNLLPRSRWSNPTYDAYTKLLPVPNNMPANPRAEPTINYLASLVKWKFDYEAWAGRWDYQLSDRHRLFARANYWTNAERNQDWLYESAPGMGELSGIRAGVGTGVDWVFTPSGTTVLNVSLGYQYFSDAVEDNPVRKILPSAVGLPSYIDQKAGESYTIPQMNWAGYDGIGRNFFGNPNRHPNYFAKADLSKVFGNHTLRVGLNSYQLFKTTYGFGTAGLITSGAFSFDNYFTRRNDDTLTPAGSLGHSWAAYMMGIPSGLTIGTYDSAAMYNAQYGWYLQDGWRVTPKLTINLGLRMEYEAAPTERFDRAIGTFNRSIQLPIEAAARGAYARNPIPELPASAFQVIGGSEYIGKNGAARRLWDGELMYLPRVAAAYQIDSRTVFRAGYGMYYDTLNVRDFTYGFPNQYGYNRDTSTVITNDFGQTFNAGNPYKGVSPLTDPFPLRADGSRFNAPVRDALGAMAVAGRGFSYFPRNMKHARQQRWRTGVQRQVGTSNLIEVAYAGSYSNRVYLTQTQQPLPEQYWASGNARNNAIASNLNANVTNPFYISNFESLRTSNPVLWQDMSTNGFFTSPTIRKSQLLRAYPHLNGLSEQYSPQGEISTHAIEARFERRFSRGFNFNLAYTGTRGRAADFYFNEFDREPTVRESPQTRPHRVTATGVMELPFGKGKPMASSGAWAAIFGGFQISGTYEYQPGGLLSFSNLFYYGDLAEITQGQRTLDQWFNTNAPFEKNSARTPAAFHRRVFPLHIDGLRADSTNIWSANIQREFQLKEGLRFQLRFDALNLFNHTTFAAPDTNPLSSNFGKVTNVTGTPPRFIQLQAKIRF